MAHRFISGRHNNLNKAFQTEFTILLTVNSIRRKYTYTHWVVTLQDKKVRDTPNS